MAVKLLLPDAIEDVGRKVIGCAIEVHRNLGPGLLEGLYETALVDELKAQEIAVSQQVELHVRCRNAVLRGHRLDLVVDDHIVLELKSITESAPVHGAQLLSYLRAADLPLGFLMNFNVPVMRDGIMRLFNERWSGFNRHSNCVAPVFSSPL